MNSAFWRLFPVALAMLCGSCGRDGVTETRKELSVQIASPERRLFEKIISVEGNIEAHEYAELSSRTAGVVDLRPFDEGSSFKKGDILFQIDKVATENEVISAEQDLKVAEAGVFKSEIDVEIARLRMEKTAVDFGRAEKLRGEKVISEDDYEKRDLVNREAEAGFKHAEASLLLAKALREKAGSALDIARKKLSDSIVRADFDGVVTAEFKEVGEYADKAKAVLRIENPSTLEAVALLGCAHYGLVEAGRTRARVSSGGITADTLVSYKAPSMDTVGRMFEVRMKIPSGRGFVSGMLCHVEIIAESRDGVGIPSASVLERAGGRKVAFIMNENGVAEEMELATGLEQDGWTEIISPDLLSSKIITQGEMRGMFRDFLGGQAGFKSTVNVPSPVGGSASQVEMEISGDDQKTIERLAAQAETIFKESPLMTDVDTNVRPGKPELKIVPKLPILNDMGISPADLGEITRGAVDGIEAGTYKVGDRSFDIRVIARELGDIEEVSTFNFSTRNGKPLDLDSISEKQRGRIPIQIVRVDKRKTAKVYANPRKGVALGSASALADREIPRTLPAGYSFRFAGQIEKMKEGQADFLSAILSAIVLTYLLIAAFLESWTKPIIIMGTVPLALIGMFMALFLAGMPLSMMGLLGFVMLIGIVVNNAILMMDELDIQMRKGIPEAEAVLLASKIVFRPILMTSIAATLGIVPMAFGTGLGSELRSSCGMGIVGGLVSSTILSLTVIPMGYLLFYVRKPKKSPPAQKIK